MNGGKWSSSLRYCDSRKSIFNPRNKIFVFFHHKRKQTRKNHHWKTTLFAGGSTPKGCWLKGSGTEPGMREKSKLNSVGEGAEIGWRESNQRKNILMIDSTLVFHEFPRPWHHNFQVSSFGGGFQTCFMSLRWVEWARGYLVGGDVVAQEYYQVISFTSILNHQSKPPHLPLVWNGKWQNKTPFFPGKSCQTWVKGSC